MLCKPGDRIWFIGSLHLESSKKFSCLIFGSSSYSVATSKFLVLAGRGFAIE